MDLNMIVRALVSLKDMIDNLLEAVIANADAIIANSDMIITLRELIGNLAETTFALFFKMNMAIQMLSGIVMENARSLEYLEVQVSQMGAQVETLQTLVYASLGLNAFCLLLIIGLVIKTNKKKCCKRKKK